MNFITTILGPLLKPLMDILGKLFLGLFLIKKGEEKQQLEDLKAEEANVATSKEIKSNLSVKSRADKRKLLQSDNDNGSKDK